MTGNARSATRSWLAMAAYVLCGCLVCAGCVQLGPDYEAPELDVRDAWDLPRGAGLEAQPDELVAWWQVFGDPTLSELVEHAYRHNYTLEAAGLRVLEARAQLGIAVGFSYPQSQIASASSISVSASEANANTASGDLNFRQYGVAGSIGWELDFWGRFRRGIESADASFRASVADYDDAMVLLIAQVVDTYTVVRTLEERLRIARENLTLQRRSYEITEVKFRNGEDSELDMQQALTLLLSTEATVPALEADRVQARNALATLLSLQTTEIDVLLEPSLGMPVPPASVAIGAPADLLRRRPDVRLAELQAVAQSSLIGVARADLYPSFVLVGSVGLEAADGTSTTRSGDSGIGELFDADALAFSGGPEVSWNLFNYGRIKNNVRVQDARLQQLLVNYQETVLRAAQEVHDAVAAYLNGQQQTEILTRTVASARRSSDLSVIRYREGFSGYQRVLDAQESLFGQEQRYVDAQGQTVRALIALYKALGGGWQLRAGEEFVDDSSKAQMSERTDWGELLEPEATDPERPRGDGTFHKPDW